jgi:hypothetical protein
MDTLQRLIDRIPGYSGYRDKENRRETDKRVREQVVAALEQEIARIEAVAAELANRRAILAVGPVDTVAKSARHLQDQIRIATYGYGGLRGDRTVDGPALDQLITFDRSLFDRVDALSTQVDTLVAADDSTRLTALGAITSTLTQLQTTFDERQFLIETGRPSTQTTPTSPLPPTDAGTRPLLPGVLLLKKGDTVEISTEHFIVDAIVALGGEQTTRLARIDVAPERWILANARFAADVKRIPFEINGSNAIVGTNSLPSHGGGSAKIEQCDLAVDDSGQLATWQVYGGESVNGPIAFVLSLPSETLSLAGHGLSHDQVITVAVAPSSSSPVSPTA